MDVSYQIPRPALVWILVAVVLVLLPQSIRMPVWISVVALLCVCWRVLIHTGRVEYPSRMVRVIVVLFTLIVSFSQIRNIGIGLDSAASLLALGFVFKLIEMRQKRDIYVVISLCFVMSMVAFLYSQSVVTTLYVGVVIAVTMGAMIAMNRSALVNDNRGTARMAMKIALQALPLTIVLFIVFPRISPLWAVPMQAGLNSTGVTDEMSPGDISTLGRSAELAFRVQFEGGVELAHEQLYWRGLVMDNFDGVTWRRTRNSSAFSTAASLSDFRVSYEDRIRTQGEPVNYNVILEPTQQPWVFGLHLAEDVDDRFFSGRSFELFNNGRITQRLSYDLSSYLQNQTDILLLGSTRNRSLELPDEGNERSREFAAELRASVASDREYVYAVLDHFSRNEYFYTLNAPLLGDNRVDEFLFDTMAGFCEHYASSFTFMMRAAGVPARVVVGYHGAETNPYENYLMVYQYNAHAWSEVWLEGEGWVRFDPTGAVSPTRIELGPQEALRDDPGFMGDDLFSAARFGGIGWLTAARLRLDAIEYEWNQLVVNYDEEVQFELFERLFGEVTEQKVIILMGSLAMIVIVAVGFAVINLEPRVQRTPINRFYLRVCRELSKLNLERERGEGPIAFKDRVCRERPELASAMTELTELYVKLNYAEKSLSEAEQKSEMQALKLVYRELRAQMPALASFRSAG
ncbi:MAG: protein-glutamine gamma-glutamyltransferase [Pseudohongiella sp.]|nr:MAG: protein-glutamine gamma-glutamyltransferase [Pseudohongiella sp.]